MQAKDVMSSDAECVKPDETLQQVAKKMKSKDVGSFPVCDNDRLAGIVTDRDIVIRCVAEGSDPSQATVRDAMSGDLVYCFEDQEISEVGQLMQRHQIRRIPVLNADKRLCGIVAMADIALKAEDSLSEDAIEAVSKPK